MRVPPVEWQIGGDLERGRKQALLFGPTFRDIIRLVRAAARIRRCWREPASNGSGFFRTCVRLVLPTSIVDSFHNSATGYRAQYYRAPALGDRANFIAIKMLVPRVEELLRGDEKGRQPWSWVERSLLDPSAKIWIHQGPWLLQARRADRRLRVARWVRHEMASDAKRRKIARWAMLTPGHEESLDIKGGFLTLHGKRMGGLKPNRSNDIHDYGFT